MSRAVAIITRTKDRPLFLPRARESVERQSFRDFVWVLVNDAGTPGPVEEQAEIARRHGLEVIVVHRERSCGMEAASNHGIRATPSRYIVIHDDDDSWEPEFLESCVDALEKEPAFVGAVTHSTKVVEEVSPAGPRVLHREPYNAWMQVVHIADLLEVNRFPPISFVFRRSVYDAVGGFDESMPVLGDWDFNLRVLLHGDLLVIPRPLANYHFRMSVPEGLGSYGNTVTAGVERHALYEMLYRNRKLREDIEAGRVGLGHLLVLGRMVAHLGWKLEQANTPFRFAVALLERMRLKKLLARLAGV